jgi:hypothetical protein
MASSNPPHSGSRPFSGFVWCGFANTTPYNVTPVLPLTGMTSLLRHPIAYLLLVRVTRSTKNASARRLGVTLWVFSITRFDMGVHSRVREYQPVVHRLRLSASP